MNSKEEATVRDAIKSLPTLPDKFDVTPRSGLPSLLIPAMNQYNFDHGQFSQRVDACRLSSQNLNSSQPSGWPFWHGEIQSAVKDGKAACDSMQAVQTQFSEWAKGTAANIGDAIRNPASSEYSKGQIIDADRTLNQLQQAMLTKQAASNTAWSTLDSIGQALNEVDQRYQRAPQEPTASGTWQQRLEPQRRATEDMLPGNPYESPREQAPSGSHYVPPPRTSSLANQGTSSLTPPAYSASNPSNFVPPPRTSSLPPPYAPHDPLAPRLSPPTSPAQQGRTRNFAPPAGPMDPQQRDGDRSRLDGARRVNQLKLSEQPEQLKPRRRLSK